MATEALIKPQPAPLNGEENLETCTNDFFKFIVDYCSTTGFKGLKGLFKENETQKRRIEELDICNRTNLSQLGHQVKEVESRDNLLREKDSQLENRDTQLKEKDDELKQKDEQIEKKNNELDERDNQLKERDDQLQERDSQLKERDEQLKERDDQIMERDGQLKDRDEQLKEKGDKLTELEGQIKEKGEQLNERDDRLKQKDDQIKQRDDQVKEREDLLTLKDTELQEKDGQLQQKEDQLKERDDELKKKDDLITGKENQIKDRDVQLKERDDHLKDKDNQIQEKNNQLAAAERTTAGLRSLITRLEERNRMDSKKIEKQSRAIDQLKNKVTLDKDVISTLREKNKTETRRVREAEAGQDHLRKTLNNMDEELQILRTRDKELESLKSLGTDLVKCSDYESKATSDLTIMFNFAYKFAQKFMFQDLGDSALAPDSWKLVRKNEAIADSDIPLPPTNSPAAKQMRLAVGLAVISKALKKHVFQPVYLSEEQNECSKLLKMLGNNPDQEAHVRSVLLKSVPELQKKNGEYRAQLAADEIKVAIKELVCPEQWETCEVEIERLCSDAVKRWKPLQMVKEQVEADLFFRYPDEWRALPMPGASPTNHSSVSLVYPSSGSNGTSGASHSSASLPLERRAPSSQQAVYEVWPVFFADGKALHTGYFIAEEQARAAMAEEQVRRIARKTARQGSDGAIGGLGHKRRNSGAFLSNGNGHVSGGG